MKRSPLKRGKGLKRAPLRGGRVALRRTRLKRQGKRREREADALTWFKRNPLFPDSLAICCAVETCPAIGHDLDAHHICSRARGAGHPLLHDTRNRAWLCRKCHDEAHRGLRPELIKSRDYLDTLGDTP